MINKTKILTWIVVLLVTINAVTIGTIIYHNYQENHQNDNIAINAVAGGNMLNGRFFRQTLGFDNEQMNAFRNANHGFRPVAMLITSRIDSLKNEMFIELQQPAPDTTKLNNMSKRIGLLHGELKYETYRFFLALKKICSPQQQAELENAFQPLFKNEAVAIPSNQQRGRVRNMN